LTSTSEQLTGNPNEKGKVMKFKKMSTVIATSIIVMCSQIAWGAIIGVSTPTDANSIVRYSFEENGEADSSAFVFDSAPAGAHNGHAYNGVDRNPPDTVLVDVPGVNGTSGVRFVAVPPGAPANYRATITPFNIPTTSYAGGDMTHEMWVTGISNTQLAGRDANFGAYLFGQGRLGEDWALSLNQNGSFQLRYNRSGSGGGEQVGTIGDELTWDDSTWYYIALVADGAGQAVGVSEYSIYRGSKAPASNTGGGLVGSFIGPSIATDGDSYYIGSGASPGAAARVLGFDADESHFSNVAKSIPEPSVAALLLLGGAGMLLRRRAR